MRRVDRYTTKSVDVAAKYALLQIEASVFVPSKLSLVVCRNPTSRFSSMSLSITPLRPPSVRPERNWSEAPRKRRSNSTPCSTFQGSLQKRRGVSGGERL